MKKLLFIVHCSLFIAWSANAQTMQLTLDDALQLALSQNPTLKVAELEVARYDYVKRETWGNLLPQISVDGNYTRAIKKQEMGGGISFGADNTLSATGNVALPLFVPQVYSLLKMNRMQADAAVEAARSSRIDMVAAVKKAFYDILLAEQSLVVLEESQATVQRTVDDTRLKFDNGLASEYDLLTAEVQLSNLDPTILQTKNSIAVAKLLLKMYLSIPEGVEITVTGRLDDMRDMVLNGTEYTTDIENNSQLRALDLQAAVLGQSLRVHNASRWPTVSAFGSVSLSGSDIDVSRFTGQPASKGLFWQQPISAGVQVSVPIFAGTTKQAGAQSIRNQMKQLDLQREYARTGVKVEVETALNNLLTARETMFAQEKTVAQADKAYSISNTRYGAGAGTILELNSAQLAQTQARLSFSQAIYNYLAAKAEYDRIIGKE